jgi:hypothetical protein
MSFDSMALDLDLLRHLQQLLLLLDAIARHRNMMLRISAVITPTAMAMSSHSFIPPAMPTSTDSLLLRYDPISSPD